MIHQKPRERVKQRTLTKHINQRKPRLRNQKMLTLPLSKEQRWNLLLGIPVKGREARGWDSYGEFKDDHTKSYYMTGRLGFTGYWRAGRDPFNSLTESMAFAFEQCDIKEKWKRMIIWNCLFDHTIEKLEFLKATTKCERKHYVICKLLEAKLKRREEKQKDKVFKEKIEELYTKFKGVTVEFTDGTKLPLNPKCLVSNDDKHKKGGKKWFETTLKQNVLPMLLTEVNQHE